MAGYAGEWQSLLLNMGYALVISTAMTIILFWMPHWQIRLGAAFFLAFAIWAIADSVKLFLRIDGELPITSPLLPELKRQHQLFSKWINTQQRSGLFLYPVSVAIGFMAGGVTGSDLTVAELMGQWQLQLLLLICIVVLTPACHWLAKWMMKVAFGNHLKQLEAHINELEQ